MAFKKQILFSLYLSFVIKVASYLNIVMCVTFLTILSHLDMGLFDSQNAKEMCFHWSISCQFIYTLLRLMYCVSKLFKIIEQDKLNKLYLN